MKSNMDPRLPLALMKMCFPYFEAMDKEGRKWFRETLKKEFVKMDFNYPNGKKDAGEKYTVKPVYMDGNEG